MTRLLLFCVLLSLAVLKVTSQPEKQTRLHEKQGQALVAAGDTAGAIREFSAMIEEEPLNTAGYIHRGGVYADEAINNDNNNQDSMKAIQDYTRAISLGAVDCYKETTSVHLRAGHYKEAVADAGMALAKCKLSPPQRAELLAIWLERTNQAASRFDSVL